MFYLNIYFQLFYDLENMIFQDLYLLIILNINEVQELGSHINFDSVFYTCHIT